MQFEAVKNEAGLNRFVMTPTKWISETNAIGIIAKSGRYGGTYAHKDIVFEFASWISPEFKLYVFKEYQRLRERENIAQALDWNLKRELSKINYKIHTDSLRYTPPLDKEKYSTICPEFINPKGCVFLWEKQKNCLLATGGAART